MRKKINLNHLSNNEMRYTRGGAELDPVCVSPNCGCLCCYAGQPGGSSSDDNCNANLAHGLHSYPCDDPTP
jgi:hypothetical protein